MSKQARLEALKLVAGKDLSPDQMIEEAIKLIDFIETGERSEQPKARKTLKLKQEKD